MANWVQGSTVYYLCVGTHGLVGWLARGNIMHIMRVHIPLSRIPGVMEAQ